MKFRQLQRQLYHLNGNVITLILFFLSALFLPASAVSAAEQNNECGADAEKIIRLAYPSAIAVSDRTYAIAKGTIILPVPENNAINPYEVVCRYWPANPDKLLVAVTIMRKESSDGVKEGDLDLLILDNGVSKIYTRLYLSDFITEDAVTLQQIAFDTAPYRLVSGRIAFGVRKSVEHNSSALPFSQTTLRLYDLIADRLRPITDDIVVEESHGEYSDNCSGEYHHVVRKLAVYSDRHNKAADIVITSREKNLITSYKEDRCVDEDRQLTSAFRLKFDGKIYNVPEELKSKVY